MQMIMIDREHIRNEHMSRSPYFEGEVDEREQCPECGLHEESEEMVLLGVVSNKTTVYYCRECAENIIHEDDIFYINKELKDERQ